MATREMIQAVREHECATTGHSYDVIMERWRGHPVALVCGNCGDSWKVAPRSETAGA